MFYPLKTLQQNIFFQFSLCTLIFTGLKIMIKNDIFIAISVYN